MLHLSAYDAAVICSDNDLVNYFESVIKHTSNNKAAANWLLGPVKSYLNDNGKEINDFTLPATVIAGLIGLIDEGKINFSNASGKIFWALLNDPDKDPLQIATDLNLLQQSDSGSLEAWVDEAIAKMPDKVREYKSGKKCLIGLFAGEVKKLSKGTADMQIVNKLLTEKLS